MGTANCSRCTGNLTVAQAKAGVCPRCAMRLVLGPPGEGLTEAPDTPAAGTSEIPEKIGPYVVIRSIGEGGMGEVFLAEQREPIRRQVALKVIKQGMDTKRVVARFEAERQALALMDHASIAKVFDAGATAQGRPYFVMEFVEGEPITVFADRRTLSLRQRIDLFGRVCAGVQHAHRKGVIHRDLKPSNILVTEQDGETVPKIIDFGIAKATGQKLTDSTLLTEIGTRVGTLEYMSPEQTELTALGVDTRTDVYSLGIVLYELLTGALPFDPGASGTTSVEELHRRIRTEEPPRPSLLLRTLGDRAEETARHRQVLLAVLKRQLEGDLDWITLKALEKEPGRRYDSPAELERDLRRHLGHEPVEARPPSTTYRLRKFVRRNRLLVASASMVLVALLAGVVGTTTFGLREARQRQEAERAQSEVEQVARFQAKMLSNMDTRGIGERLMLDLRERVAELHRSQGRTEAQVEAAVASFEASVQGLNATDVALRVVDEEILARALETLHTEFAEQPLIDARLRHTIGTTYARLGFLGRAELSLEAAVETRERLLGADHTDTLDSMIFLANLYHNQGRYNEAEELFIKTLETQKRTKGPEHKDTLLSMDNLASIYRKQGRYAEAEELFLTTLEALKRVLGADHLQTLQSMGDLANLYWTLDRFAEAEPLYVQALEGKKRLLGVDHKDTMRTMNNLATLYEDQGRFAESEQLHLETLEIKKRVLGSDHQDTLNSMNNMASLYARQGRLAEAEPLFVDTLNARVRVLGPEHPSTLRSANNLATLYEELGRHDEAEPLYVNTFETRRRVLGAEHRSTLSSMNVLAWFLLSREPEASRDPGRALALALEVAEKTGYAHAGYLDTLSLAYHKTGQTVKAIDNQKTAIALLPEKPSEFRTTLEETLAEYEAAETIRAE